MTNKFDSDWLKDDELDSGGGLGDDWESAFQAGDFDFSPAGEHNIFGDSAATANPYEFVPPPEHELANLPDLDQESIAAFPDSAKEPFQKPAQTTDGNQRGLGQALRERFVALPLLHKFVVCGGFILGLGLFLTAMLTALLPGASRMAELSAPSSSPPFPFPAQPESAIRKWKLEPFVLPIAGTESTGKAVFLEVDLTLLLVLAPNEELPLGQKIFIRDLIYQFYQKQPHDTLRRFALARGEMNRSLLTLLREQWPESAVEKIIFNRYQIR
jgi:hypothetical protein